MNAAASCSDREKLKQWNDHAVIGVITASEPSWTTPFSGLSPHQFGKLITALRREGADPVRMGRPWGLPLEDRVLLVAAYWLINLTLRRLAPLFGMLRISHAIQSVSPVTCMPAGRGAVSHP